MQLIVIKEADVSPKPLSRLKRYLSVLKYESFRAAGIKLVAPDLYKRQSSARRLSIKEIFDGWNMFPCAKILVLW